MNAASSSVVRSPTSNDGTSFVPAQIVVHVYASPEPNSPGHSSGTCFCLALQNDQISLRSIRVHSRFLRVTSR